MIDNVFAAPKGGDLEAGIEFALKNNLSYELPSFYHVENLDNKAEWVARYGRLLEGFRGTLSMHGPIFDINVVSLDPEIMRISRHRYRQAIEVAKDLNVRYLVLHSQWSPIYPAANATKDWMMQLVDFWKTWIETDLKDSNITVLIENFLDPSPETMLSLLTQVNSPCLKACLDIGHVNIFSSLSPIDWVQALGGHLAYIHAHNNAGQVDSHDSFDKGLLDMGSFLNHLALLPQKIHLAIETASISGLEESYALVKPYLALQNEQFASKSFLI